MTTAKAKAVAIGFGLLFLYSVSPGACGIGTLRPPGGDVGGPPFDDISWQSAGDSFSSGEGVYGNVEDCAQSQLAYGPVAQKVLDAGQWNFSSATFTACTGRRTEEYFNVVPGSKAELENKAAMWDWGRQQGGPERVDVLTMSFGGNDIGFAEVIRRCLFFFPKASISWSGLLTRQPDVVLKLTGCDVPRDELVQRVKWLADPSKDECDGWRTLGTADYGCPLRLQSRQGSVADFFADLVRNQLTTRGHLYVVGYPRIFAPSTEWPAWAATCQGVARGDADMLGEVAGTLNEVLNAAVQQANDELGTTKVHFLDRLSLFRSGSHELCGTGDKWINGITLERGDGFTLRWLGSFHPNRNGHGATASRLVELVTTTFR